MDGSFEIAALPWIAALALWTQASDRREPGPTPAELVTPTRLTRLVAAPDGGPIAILDGRRAWVLGRRDLAPELAIESGPYVAQGDPWSEGRFSEDGARLALWSFRGSSACVDVASARVLSATGLIEPSGRVPALADGDARLIAQASANRLVVHSCADGTEVFAVGWPKPASFALADDGHVVVYEGFRGVERVFLDEGVASDPTVLAAGQWDELALLPGNESLLLVRKTEARCIDVESGRTLAAATWEGAERRLQGFDREGAIAVLAGAQSLQAVSTGDLSLAWELEDVQGAFVDAASGTLWTKAWQQPGTVHDVTSGELLWAPDEREFRPWFTQVVSGKEGELLAVRRDERALVALDARTGARKGTLELATGEDCWAGVLADGKVWVASARGTVSLLDSASGATLASRKFSERLKDVRATSSGFVARHALGRAHVLGDELEVVSSFDASGHALASADGRRMLSFGVPVGGVRVHAADGGLLHTLGASSGDFDRVACDRTGETIAAMRREGALRLFRGEDEVRIETLGDHPRSVAIDPQGGLFAVGFDAPRVEVFDTETGGALAALELGGWWPFGVDVRNLDFDPRGEFLVATTGDIGSVHVWRTADWERAWMHDYSGGNPSALVVAFDDVARRLWVSGMTNHTQAVHDLAQGTRVANLVGTNLGHFAPAPATGAGSADGIVAGLRRGGLVLLDADGRVRLERLDLGPHGVVVSTPDGDVRGDAEALRRVFVRADGALVRADRHVTERARGRPR